MCFASSIVESHRKLFIAPSASNDAGGGAPATSSGGGQAAGRGSDSLASTTEKRSSRRAPEVAAQKMSRTKSRLQEVCGDCGASDPSWASINRGILLCSDCCSVHRSLGRHISIVKSLRQGTWEPSVLNFVNSLNAHGANSVWEHHLLDLANTSGAKSAGRIRKPTPKDPLHPVKSDFIKAKHVNLQFVLKPNLHDDDGDCSLTGSSLEHELSKQLHASVRTSNLETSLRLLVQGADPNFFHEEKRSTCMHVAAKFGQASQIELLIVYGGNINAIDGNGLTPLEVAKANNHSTIAERLLDAMYDVTDRLIMFLGGKKPDHTTGRHLVIPDTCNGEISEQLKIARGRLQLVPNKMFEELVMDLYDEVDRRESEAIWATSTLNGENVAVPFLPANPFLSATRNQGRQKLARFSRSEFAGLLTDVLIDARRRQNMANLRPMEASSVQSQSYPYNASTSMTYNSIEHDPNLSDDEPIYDPVASDDDYAPVPAMAQQPAKPPPVPPAQSQFEMENLRKQISVYESEIYQLKTVVQKLSCENSELKSKFSHGPMTPAKGAYDEPLRIDLSSPDADNEPHSLPDRLATGEPAATGADGATNSDSSTPSSTNNSNQSTIKRPASMYERRAVSTYGQKTFTPTRTSIHQMAGRETTAERPFREQVMQRTDQVTQHLKELNKVLQEPDADLGPGAERTRGAVTELLAIFTTTTRLSDNIRETLKQLSHYNTRIQHECENLQNAYASGDKGAIDKSVDTVRSVIYYIASGIRTLVTQVE